MTSNFFKVDTMAVSHPYTCITQSNRFRVVVILFIHIETDPCGI